MYIILIIIIRVASPPIREVVHYERYIFRHLAGFYIRFKIFVRHAKNMINTMYGEKGLTRSSAVEMRPQNSSNSTEYFKLENENI